MKNVKYFSVAILACSLLMIPAVAQEGRSNKGGVNRGDSRADVVKASNKKQDKDRDKNPDNDKKGKHKGETKGKHKAKGHSHQYRRSFYLKKIAKYFEEPAPGRAGSFIAVLLLGRGSSNHGLNAEGNDLGADHFA